MRRTTSRKTYLDQIDLLYRILEYVQHLVFMRHNNRYHLTTWSCDNTTVDASNFNTEDDNYSIIILGPPVPDETRWNNEFQIGLQIRSNPQCPSAFHRSGCGSGFRYLWGGGRPGSWRSWCPHPYDRNDRIDRFCASSSQYSPASRNW